MKSQCLAMASMVLGLALISGCPDGADYGLGDVADCGCYEIIPDGTYGGDANGTIEVWNWDEPYGQASGGSETYAEFWDGSVLKSSGDQLQIGDYENVDYGAFVVSREVYDVYFDDWYYEISYDVWAQWGDIPMEGTEYISFSSNSDGSLTMYDTLELVSSDDGGAWTFHANSSGTLYPIDESQYIPEDNLSNPILDVKSGKMIIADPVKN